MKDAVLVESCASSFIFRPEKHHAGGLCTIFLFIHPSSSLFPYFWRYLLWIYRNLFKSHHKLELTINMITSDNEEDKHIEVKQIFPIVTDNIIKSTAWAENGTMEENLILGKGWNMYWIYWRGVLFSLFVPPTCWCCISSFLDFKMKIQMVGS